MKPHTDHLLRSMWLLSLVFGAAGCSSSNMRPVTSPPPRSAGEARVHFYRHSAGMFGAAAYFPLYDGETLIGLLESGCRIEYRCAPGKRMIVGWGPAGCMGAVLADLQAGRTYCIRVDLMMGTNSNMLSLLPILKSSPEWGGRNGKSSFLEMPLRELVPQSRDNLVKDHRKRWEEVKAHFEGPGKDELFTIHPEDGWPEE